MNEFVRRVGFPGSPLASRMTSLDIELTERCNNDCIHCCINLPANDRNARSREMNTAQIKGILREAADLGCLQVRFTGGEPLLRRDFKELYLFARRLGLKVSLFTNGCLITQRIAQLFAKIPPLEPIEITVYGMRPESYEAVTRKPGTFALFRRGVELLLQHHVPFVLKSVILPPNASEIEEFEEWTKTVPWMRNSPSYSMFYDLRNRRDDTGKNRAIETLRVAPKDGLGFIARDESGYRQSMTEFASRCMSGATDERLFACGLTECPCVDSYGRAQPCMGLRAPEMTVQLAGDEPRNSGKPNMSSDQATRNGSSAVGLAAALNRFPELRSLRATNPEYLRRCARCVLRGFCEQCPAKSWAEHGTLDTPVEYLCEVAHAQARYLGWLGDNERGWEVTNWQDRINFGSAPRAGETRSSHGANKQITRKEVCR
jgi:sulfatase maturation enzyme AslB (radical SAM superfamily)